MIQPEGMSGGERKGGSESCDALRHGRNNACSSERPASRKRKKKEIFLSLVLSKSVAAVGEQV